MNARKLSLLALAAAALAFAGSASAQTRTYNFTDRNVAGAPLGGCNTNMANTGSFTGALGNSVFCQQAGNGTTTAGSQALTVQAWANDGTGSTYRAAAVNDQGASGFGVWNATEGIGAAAPAHSMDNETPGIDLLRLDFSVSQALTSVTLGWTGVDGDFQVLRWGGAGPAASISGRTATQLLSDGWVLMGTGVGSNTVFNGLSTGDTDQTFTFNSGNLTSTSWLISAYNSSFSTAGATTGLDQIKIGGITTFVPGGSVSAPGTLALAGLGLLGAGLLRRRNG